MTGTITAPPDHAVDRHAIGVGLALALVGLGSVAALSVRAVSGRYSWTLYPVLTWLVVGLVAAGAVLTLVGAFGRPSLVVAGAAVAGVGAAQVAGMAVVAARHWHPAMGMGAFGGNLVQLQHTAWLLVGFGSAGVLIALWSLRRERALPAAVPRRARIACAVAGLAIVVGMPAIAGSSSPENRDLKSLSAYAVMWSLPWGVAVALCGWLDRVASAAALAGVAACAVFTVAMTPMQDIVIGDAYRAGGVLVVVAVAVVACLRLRRTS